MVCPCCSADPTGTCCEFSCTGCGICYYEWNGTAYVLVSETIEACPTTECAISECPETGAGLTPPVTEYIENVPEISYTPCCNYPDSIWLCSEVTGPNCYSGSWAQGETCAETEEAIQTQCQDQAFP